jgi:predicted phage tail protein
LGARFGRVHKLAVRDTKEAIRALSVVIPGFRKFLQESKRHGLTFACFLGRMNIGKDGLEFPAGRREIRIAPVIAGSKKGGIFQTIAGAVLAVVGAVMMAYEIPGGAQVFGMGASMALGGVVQMLSKQTGGLSSAADNGTSYYFNGPVNSSAQGEPVPVVYGEILTGSKVGSSSIVAEDLAQNSTGGN